MNSKCVCFTRNFHTIISYESKKLKTMNNQFAMSINLKWSIIRHLFRGKHFSLIEQDMSVTTGIAVLIVIKLASSKKLEIVSVHNSFVVFKDDFKVFLLIIEFF